MMNCPAQGKIVIGLPDARAIDEPFGMTSEASGSGVHSLHDPDVPWPGLDKVSNSLVGSSRRPFLGGSPLGGRRLSE